MNEFSNPHDLFFRETFSRPEVARDFLENYLPAEITALLDLNNLDHKNETFIDPELREHQSDILYSTNLLSGEPSYIYLLFEHKSTPEPDTPLQLLRYTTQIWHRDQRQKLPLRPIIPIVLYHGRKKWRIATNFGDLFVGPEPIRPYWPSFRYELRDLSHYRDEEIRGAALLQICLRLMKHIYDRDLMAHLPAIFSLFNKLATSKTALEYLYTTLRYLSAAAPYVTEKELKQLIDNTPVYQGDEIMPTLAQQWLQQGVQQGILQGVQQGIQQSIQQGFQQGVQQGSIHESRYRIMELLTIRLGAVPAGLSAHLETITNREILNQLFRQAAITESITAFSQFLARVAP